MRKFSENYETRKLVTHNYINSFYTLEIAKFVYTRSELYSRDNVSVVLDLHDI